MNRGSRSNGIRWKITILRQKTDDSNKQKEMNINTITCYIFAINNDKYFILLYLCCVFTNLCLKSRWSQGKNYAKFKVFDSYAKGMEKYDLQKSKFVGTMAGSFDDDVTVKFVASLFMPFDSQQRVDILTINSKE